MKANRPFRALMTILVLGALAACGGVMKKGSQDYPSRSIDYVVAFDPGGESDITARIQQKPLEKALGTNVNITYKPGAAGALAWSDLTRKKPDGYTIAGFNLPHIISQPMVSEDVGYETSDLKVVNIFQSTPNMLVVPADSPIKSLEDYIAAARKKSDAVSIGGTGKYTPNHIATLLLEKQADVELAYTEFSGTGATIPALLGGHVDSLFTFSTQLRNQKGKMRPLAVASEKRIPGFDNVPTFKEKGFDVVGSAYRGVLVPKDTPDSVVDKLATALREVNSSPEVKKAYKENGFVREDYGPQESEQFIEKRQKFLEKLFSELGVLK